MNSSDLASIASLATAGGTLVLAVATFAAVRSANRAARAAEQSLLVGLRPLLVPSRLQDETQKVMFGDGKWLQIPGGRATLQAEDEVIYLTMSLRNAGRGIAVVHGWRFYGNWEADRPEPVAGTTISDTPRADAQVPPDGSGARGRLQRLKVDRAGCTCVSSDYATGLRHRHLSWDRQRVVEKVRALVPRSASSAGVRPS